MTALATDDEWAAGAICGRQQLMTVRIHQRGIKPKAPVVPTWLTLVRTRVVTGAIEGVMRLCSSLAAPDGPGRQRARPGSYSHVMSHYFAFVALVAVLVLIRGPAVILVMQKAVTMGVAAVSASPLACLPPTWCGRPRRQPACLQ
jgi:hypothetical protein